MQLEIIQIQLSGFEQPGPDDSVINSGFCFSEDHRYLVLLSNRDFQETREIQKMLGYLHYFSNLMIKLELN